MSDSDRTAKGIVNRATNSPVTAGSSFNAAAVCNGVRPASSCASTLLPCSKQRSATATIIAALKNSDVFQPPQSGICAVAAAMASARADGGVRLIGFSVECRSKALRGPCLGGNRP